MGSEQGKLVGKTLNKAPWQGKAIASQNIDLLRTLPKLATTNILTVDAGRTPEQDEFFRSSELARSRGWTVLTMEGDHNVQWSKPKELVRLLEEAP